MGEWYTTHQNWTWCGHGNVVVDMRQSRTYIASENRHRPEATETDRVSITERMQPADVELGRTGRVKILYTSEMLLKYKEKLSIESYIDSLPAAYQQTIGLDAEESTLKTLTNYHTRLIAVSDGSVKCGEGSAGYVLSNVDDDRSIIGGSLVVGRAAEDMNSYQAELTLITTNI